MKYIINILSKLLFMLFLYTHVGINGAGSACPCGLPGGIGGAPPPGRFGIAGAGRPELGGGGGALEPNDPKSTKN